MANGKEGDSCCLLTPDGATQEMLRCDLMCSRDIVLLAMGLWPYYMPRKFSHAIVVCFIFLLSCMPKLHMTSFAPLSQDSTQHPDAFIASVVPERVQWMIVHELVHIFGRTWSERSVFCLMSIIVNAFILAFTNSALAKFCLIRESARFP